MYASAIAATDVGKGTSRRAIGADACCELGDAGESDAVSYKLDYSEADLLHVLGQVVREFLPRGKGFAAEAAGFVLGQPDGVLTALFGCVLGLAGSEPVHVAQMPDEVPAPNLPSAAVADVAGPRLERPVNFVLVRHPVGLLLEHLGLLATLPCAGEGLNIFVHMIDPVMRCFEFLRREAQLTFKLCREGSCWWHGNALRGITPPNQGVGAASQGNALGVARAVVGSDCLLVFNPEVEEAAVPQALLVGDADGQVFVLGAQERVQRQDVLSEALKAGCDAVNK